MPNKVALVTGGGRGIGRAIVLRLAQDGFDMVINSRQEHTGKAVAEEVRKIGRKALALPGDVGKAADVKAVFAKALKEYGRLDALVTNAGVSQINPWEELNEEIWDRVVDINAKGTYLSILEAIQPMVQQKWGRIITIGSAYSIQGEKKFVAYSASKFAVRGMTQAFAKELGPYGITVNCVLPGHIWTDMYEATDKKLALESGLKPGEIFKRVTEQFVLLPKSGVPDDVAAVVSFMASEDAHYITAATIPAGGGCPIF
jgi:meso-butanediol dehydrogenase / (S,S)-butanediol dehydrogenase / diacetyl reductase